MLEVDIGTLCSLNTRKGNAVAEVSSGELRRCKVACMRGVAWGVIIVHIFLERKITVCLSIAKDSWLQYLTCSYRDKKESLYFLSRDG